MWTPEKTGSESVVLLGLVTDPEDVREEVGERMEDIDVGLVVVGFLKKAAHDTQDEQHLHWSNTDLSMFKEAKMERGFAPVSLDSGFPSILVLG